MDTVCTPKVSTPRSSELQLVPHDSTESDAGQPAQMSVEYSPIVESPPSESDNESVASLVIPRRADTPVPKESAPRQRHIEIRERSADFQEDDQNNYETTGPTPVLSTIEEIRSRKKVKPRKTRPAGEAEEMVD